MENIGELEPQTLAEACAQAMWADDKATQQLGMRMDHIAPGAATLSVDVTSAMTNGHRTCHGGYIFTLADSAFAFACNSYNQRTVAQHCAITYLAPAYEQDRLTATAVEIVRRDRSGIYDVKVTNQHGKLIAEFRGHSRTIKGNHLPAARQDQE